MLSLGLFPNRARLRPGLARASVPRQQVQAPRSSTTLQGVLEQQELEQTQGLLPQAPAPAPISNLGAARSRKTQAAQEIGRLLGKAAAQVSLKRDEDRANGAACGPGSPGSSARRSDSSRNGAHGRASSRRPVSRRYCPPLRLLGLSN